MGINNGDSEQQQTAQICAHAELLRTRHQEQERKIKKVRERREQQMNERRFWSIRAAF